MHQLTVSPRPRTLLGLAAAGLLTLALAPAPAFAAGGSPAQIDESVNEGPSGRPLTPSERADLAYNQGLRTRDKAWKMEEKLAKETKDKKRQKLEEKISKAWEDATKHYITAIQTNREHYQAFSSLGYALRKRGLYADAIQAYDRALGLAPDYAEAIEYRGQAYLALNRIDDAKEAYMSLFSTDREKADMLFEAMKSWVAQQQENPTGVSEDQIKTFAEWVAQRDRIASHHGSLTEQQARAW